MPRLVREPRIRHAVTKPHCQAMRTVSGALLAFGSTGVHCVPSPHFQPRMNLAFGDAPVETASHRSIGGRASSS